MLLVWLLLLWYRFLPGFAPFVDGTVIVGVSTNANRSMPLPMGSAISRYLFNINIVSFNRHEAKITITTKQFVFAFSTIGIEMADFSKSEIIFGVTTLESYLDLSAQDLEFGFNETRRDRILRTYVRNNFNYHLNEIYAALKVQYYEFFAFIFCLVSFLLLMTTFF